MPSGRLNPEWSYFAFEGPDGGGKTTQIKTFVEELPVRFPNKKFALVREPGGTEVGDQIRTILLSVAGKSTAELDKRCELLLFSAARAQLRAEIMEPIAKTGGILLSDRCSDSTRVYQVAQGLPTETINLITEFALDTHRPHRVYILDVPVEIMFERRRISQKALDRIEARARDFHERVRQGYLDLAHTDNKKYVVIDGTAPKDVIHDRIWCSMLEFMLETDRIDAPTFLKLRPSSQVPRQQVLF